MVILERANGKKKKILKKDWSRVKYVAWSLETILIPGSRRVQTNCAV